MKVIDLSHILHPGKEPRTLDITEIEAPSITGAPSEEGWYIMHEVSMVSHIGTHLEVPYHCFPGGKDLAGLAAGRFVGEGVVLDLRDAPPKSGVTLEKVQEAAEAAGGIGKGAAVLCMTGMSQHYKTEKYSEAPYLTGEAVEWILSHNIKLLGIDTGGAGDPHKPDRENHLPIFRAGVIYIENLTNLDKIPAKGAIVVALPPAIEGLESFPVRVVALVR